MTTKRICQKAFGIFFHCYSLMSYHIILINFHIILIKLGYQISFFIRTGDHIMVSCFKTKWWALTARRPFPHHLDGCVGRVKWRNISFFKLFEGLNLKLDGRNKEFNTLLLLYYLVYRLYTKFLLWLGNLLLFLILDFANDQYL